MKKDGQRNSKQPEGKHSAGRSIRLTLLALLMLLIEAFAGEAAVAALDSERPANDE